MSFSSTQKAVGFSAGVAAIVFVGFMATSGQFVQGPSIVAVTTSASSGLSGGCTSGVCAITMLATCNAGEALGWDGSSWVCRQTVNDYRSKHLEWTDEYMGGTCGNNAQCGSLFVGSVSGSNANLFSPGGAASTRPGLIQLYTGTTTTGIAQLVTGSTYLDFSSYTKLQFEAVVGFTQLSTGTDEYAALVGFGDTSLIDQVDGCYFLYDRANTAAGGPNSSNADTLSCWCASNSTRTKYLMNGSVVSDGSFTTVSAPVGAYTLPNTNIRNLKIVMTGSTLAEFYVDGVKSCQISTNLPSGSSRVTGARLAMFKSAGTTPTAMHVDYTRLALDLTTARTP